MDIGKRKRIIYVEPLRSPVPPQRQPAPAPKPEKVPVAPKREKVGA